MLGIQKTIAICYEWHTEFIGNMKKSVEYAMHVYLDPRRYTIRLIEKFMTKEEKAEQEAFLKKPLGKGEIRMIMRPISFVNDKTRKEQP